MAIDVNPTVRDGVVGYMSLKKFEPSIIFFNNFFCIESTYHYQTTCMVSRAFSRLVPLCGHNTPNFMATSTKRFELHILAPLPTFKICKNYKTLLYLMSCT